MLDLTKGRRHEEEAMPLSQKPEVYAFTFKSGLQIIWCSLTKNLDEEEEEQWMILPVF